MARFSSEAASDETSGGATDGAALTSDAVTSQLEHLSTSLERGQVVAAAGHLATLMVEATHAHAALVLGVDDDGQLVALGSEGFPSRPPTLTAGLAEELHRAIGRPVSAHTVVLGERSPLASMILFFGRDADAADPVAPSMRLARGLGALVALAAANGPPSSAPSSAAALDEAVSSPTRSSRHALRNTLHSLSLYLQVIRRRLPEDDRDAQESVSTMRRLIAEASDLIA